MVKKTLLTRTMRDAEPAYRLDRPRAPHRRRDKPAGEHPTNCLCRDCENREDE